MRWKIALVGTWALIALILQVRHLKKLREAREDAQLETDRYWQRGGRAR